MVTPWTGGLDAWRRLIYDNDKDPSVRYCQWDASDMANEDSAKALFKQLDKDGDGSVTAVRQH